MLYKPKDYTLYIQAMLKELAALNRYVFKSKHIILATTNEVI